MDIIKAYQGIYPGKIIFREIRKRGLTQRMLADAVGGHFQTLNAIIRGRRQIPTELSFKLDRLFGFKYGTFLVLQAYYLGAQYAEEASMNHPVIRKVVFWDVDMSMLDWEKHKDFIIQRVNSRGNQSEKQQVAAYYGYEQ